MQNMMMIHFSNTDGCIICDKPEKKNEKCVNMHIKIFEYGKRTQVTNFEIRYVFLKS